MTENIASEDTRIRDLFHHIDMGFINHRLVLSALGAQGREIFEEKRSHGDDHLTSLANDHLLVTFLLDLCDHMKVPTLDQAILKNEARLVFRSSLIFAPCDDVYNEERIKQPVILDIDYGMPVFVEYHTKHICSDTGRLMLSEGGTENYRESVVGILHRKDEYLSIEPLVMGSPWYEHQRNKDCGANLMWEGLYLGEILPQDIDQFKKLSEVIPSTEEEWMSVMKEKSEEFVKQSFAKLLREPTKKDWGGESNDHFSGSLTIGERRKTAAFLLKGPSSFREMTLDMCGKRADQIHRLANSGADISIVQHSHLVGEVVRNTLRRMVVYPGSSFRKYCVIDGQDTYRILKAYDFV